MVNRVVFRALKEINQIGHLEGDQRFLVRKRPPVRKQIAQVINVRENVPAQNQICLTPRLFYFFSAGGIEKFAPGSTGFSRDVLRRFHAKNFATTLLEFFQERARISSPSPWGVPK